MQRAENESAVGFLPSSKTDSAVWRPSDGNWHIFRSSTNTLQVTQWGAGSSPSNDIPVPGDYDGDGKTDIAIWRPVEANWYMINSRTNTVRVQQWGAAGDTPALLKGVH
jgi:hypothetical protein